MDPVSVIILVIFGLFVLYHLNIYSYILSFLLRSSKRINLCQLRSGCFGCCGYSWGSKKEILEAVNAYTQEFREISERANFPQAMFRDRKRGKLAGVCKNVVFEDGKVFCPLHKGYSGMEFRKCNRPFLCKTYIYFLLLNSNLKKKFIIFIQNLNYDVIDYSFKMRNGGMVSEFRNQLRGKKMLKIIIPVCIIMLSGCIVPAKELNLTHLGAVSGAGAPNFLGGAYSVLAIGEVLYVSGYADNTLVTFNVSDPASITVLGNISGSGAPNYLYAPDFIAVSGDVAYVAAHEDDALSAFNISDPTNIQHLGSIYGAGAPNYLDCAFGVAVSGEVAYVAACYDNSLVAVDVSDATSPQVIGVMLGAGAPNYLAHAYGVIASGDVAYVVAPNDDALVAFNISDPTNMQLMGNATGAGAPNHLDGAWALDKDGDVIYVASYEEDALTTFNVSDPYDIKHMGNITGNGSPYYLENARSVAVANEIAYVVAYTDNSLTTFDVSDPYSPQFIDALIGKGDPNYLGGVISVYVSGTTVYAASSDDNAISVFSVSDQIKIKNNLSEGSYMPIDTGITTPKVVNYPTLSDGASDDNRKATVH